MPPASNVSVRHPWLANVLPFLSSLAVHGAVVVLALLLIQTYHSVPAPAPKLETQTAASTSDVFSHKQLNSAYQSAELNDQTFRRAAQDEFENEARPDGWAQKPGVGVLSDLAGGGKSGATDPKIALGGKSNFGVRGKGIGVGEGDGYGSGRGGGPLAPFGAPAKSAGLAPRVFDTHAKTIVYVCDASGSMIDTFDTLKRELKQSINGLTAVQAFNVVFFQDTRTVSLGDSMLMATQANKRKAAAFIDGFMPAATTDPIPGVELALKFRPQLVHLLTDADFPDNDKVLQTIRRLNVSKQTQVNTIAFTGADDVSETFVNLMKQIASENRGVFKHVRESELN